MISLIECGADEVGHSCINDGKLFSNTLFDIKGLGDKRATACNHRSTQFEMNLLIRTEFEEFGVGVEIVFEVGDGYTIRMLIVNTQSTTYVDILY